MPGYDITEVDVFTAKVHVPLSGELVKAADLDDAAQALANRTLNLSTHKVAKAGDTMTGKLTVGAATGQNFAVDATGNGGGGGVRGTGGSGGGTGVTAVGGAGGGNALSATATGAGTAVVASAASGIGVYASCSSGPAVQVHTGNMVFSGAAPAIETDPVYTGYLCKANIVYAHGYITTDGSGTGAAHATTHNGSYNIKVSDVTSTYVEVEFLRPFADAHYTPVASIARSPGYVPCPDMISATASKLRIPFQQHAGGAIDPSAVAVAFSIIVCGRQ